MAYSDVLGGFNAKAARVGVTGAVRRTRLGAKTPVLGPSYSYEEPADEWTNLGYLSPDGVEIAFDEDTTEYIPWQELSAIRQDITKSAKTIKLTLWQFNRGNAELFFGLAGGSVKVDEKTGNWSFYESAVPTFERGMFSLDVVDGDAAMRLVAFEAQVTSRDSVVLKRDEMIGLTVTLTLYPANSDDYDGVVAGKTAFWQFSKSWGGEADSSTSDGSSPLTVSTVSLPSATVGTAYTANLTADGGKAPYAWSVTSGDLPAGLALASDGTLSGTPTAEGEATVTVKVTDAGALVASKSLTLTVNAGEGAGE